MLSYRALDAGPYQKQTLVAIAPVGPSVELSRSLSMPWDLDELRAPLFLDLDELSRSLVFPFLLG